MLRRLRLEPLEDRRLLAVVPMTTAVGDYNGDLVVDIADFTVWRDTLGQEVPSLTGADGAGGGSIDTLDYQVWRERFGTQLNAPPTITSVTATQVGELNSSAIALAFSSPIVAGFAGAIVNGAQVTGVAANPLHATLPGAEPEFVEVAIGVTAAELSPDGMTLTLITNLWTPAGATITLTNAGLSYESGVGLLPVDIQTAVTQSDADIYDFTWAYRNDVGFEATNLALFGTDSPIQPQVRPDNEVRADFQAFMQLKEQSGLLNNSDYSVAQLNALLDDSAVSQLIPSINLRAALLSLAGTSAESAIAVHLDGANSSTEPWAIVFSDSIPPGAQAVSVTLFDGSRETRILTSEAGTHFVVLSTIVVHEVQHQDGAGATVGGLATGNSLPEEIVANTLESIVYGEQLLVDDIYARNLVDANTFGVVNSNFQLWQLLNSSDVLNAANPKQAMLRGGVNIHNGAPQVEPFPSLEAWFEAIQDEPDIDTADVPAGVFSILDDILSRLNGTPIDVPGFTDEAIGLVNGFRGDAEARFRLAELLQLRIVPTPPAAAVVGSLEAEVGEEPSAAAVVVAPADTVADDPGAAVAENAWGAYALAPAPAGAPATTPLPASPPLAPADADEALLLLLGQQHHEPREPFTEGMPFDRSDSAEDSERPLASLDDALDPLLTAAL